MYLTISMIGLSAKAGIEGNPMDYREAQYWLIQADMNPKRLTVSISTDLYTEMIKFGNPRNWAESAESAVHASFQLQIVLAEHFKEMEEIEEATKEKQ